VNDLLRIIHDLQNISVFSRDAFLGEQLKTVFPLAVHVTFRQKAKPTPNLDYTVSPAASRCDYTPQVPPSKPMMTCPLSTMVGTFLVPPEYFNI
jgi:hypothetical protein